MSKKVFIIDDDPTICRSLESLLSLIDCETQSATRYEEAVEQMQSFHPDVVLIDWQLRGEAKGVDLASLVLDRFPGIRVVLMSGYDIEQLESEIPASLEVFWIQKPCSLEELRCVAELR